MSAPWGGIFKINNQELLERGCFGQWVAAAGLGEEHREEGWDGAGGSCSGRASHRAVPSHVSAEQPPCHRCLSQHHAGVSAFFPSGKSPPLPNRVFYRLPRLSAKLCKTRVGSEGWGCSPKGRKLPCLEPEDRRGGSGWCSPWARK